MKKSFFTSTIGRYVIVVMALVPDALLAIFPGSSHISVMMETNWLVSVIDPFLEKTLQAKR